MRELIAVLLAASCVAGLNAGEPAKWTPADDLKLLQGTWKVTSSGQGSKMPMPKESGLRVVGTELVFEGNRVKHKGKVVLTLANDVTLPSAEEEIGLKGSRLMMLTLPDGRGLLCSYRITEGKVKIQYPHTSICNRSGWSTVLERPSK